LDRFRVSCGGGGVEGKGGKGLVGDDRVLFRILEDEDTDDLWGVEVGGVVWEDARVLCFGGVDVMDDGA